MNTSVALNHRDGITQPLHFTQRAASDNEANQQRDGNYYGVY